MAETLLRRVINRRNHIRPSSAGLISISETGHLPQSAGRRYNGSARFKEKESSPARANRYLALIRAILRRAAREWEWIDGAPAIKLYPEPKRRVRWITREEAERLIALLPQHLAAMVQFSLATGLRQANVAGLTWSQVDLQRAVAWIHPDQAKARRAIPVPLNEEAVSAVRAQLGKHSTHAFTFRSRPIRQTNTRAWRQALRKAGIQNFRWHDLRHTWASWHVQAGTPLHALQELGGWESPEMVRRYAHLKVVGRVGIEPTTLGLRVPCSAN